MCYSQWGEDMILKRLCGSHAGFYVDVGAYHPLHYSNTYLLYKRGWQGINIDPNPDSIRLFNLHRRRDININCGVSKEVATKKYFIFNHQSCNTFSEKQKDAMLQKRFIRLVNTADVECLPLQNILDTHARGMQIDFLNVDVEGMNLEVLQSLDWNQVLPRVICIEDDEFDFSNTDGYGSAIYTFLSDLPGNPYMLHSKIGFSCIYVRKA